MTLHFHFGSRAEQYVLLFTLKLSFPESHSLKKVKSCNFISAPQTVHLALFVEKSVMHLCLSLLAHVSTVARRDTGVLPQCQSGVGGL